MPGISALIRQNTETDSDRVRPDRKPSRSRTYRPSAVRGAGRACLWRSTTPGAHRSISGPSSTGSTSRSIRRRNISWGTPMRCSVSSPATKPPPGPLPRPMRRLGYAPHSDDCFLALRGLRTLAVRLERHWRSGLVIAEWLHRRPEVAEVLHPALPGAPGHELWLRDFKGAAGLFAIILKPYPKQAIHRMLNALRIFGMGYSWGGYESLIVPFDCTAARTATLWNGRPSASPPHRPRRCRGPEAGFGVWLRRACRVSSEKEKPMVRHTMRKVRQLTTRKRGLILMLSLRRSSASSWPQLMRPSRKNLKLSLM